MQMVSGEGFLDMCDEEFDGIWCCDEGLYAIQFRNTWILISEKQYKEIVSFLNEYR